MQMLRDQGGPSSFDGSGRKMRPGPGPHIGGPTQILVPPSFRPDPRRMRRYVILWSFLAQFLLLECKSCLVVYSCLAINLLRGSNSINDKAIFILLHQFGEQNDSFTTC